MQESSSHWTNWLAEMPVNRIKEIREKIMLECGISKATFYFWRGQYSEVPKLAQAKIIEIAGKELDFSFQPREEPRTTAL